MQKNAKHHLTKKKKPPTKTHEKPHTNANHQQTTSKTNQTNTDFKMPFKINYYTRR